VKALHELKKLERFQEAMPPKTEEEYNFLEQSLLTDGCLDPIRAWHNIIIDGHARYDICHKNGIPFEVKEMDFKNEDEAFAWIIMNQLSCRNLSTFAKCELELRYEPQLWKKAKERQIRRLADSAPANLQEQTGGTFDNLGNVAVVSGRNMRKIKWLRENADEETQEQLCSGKISINHAYTSLRETEPVRSLPSYGMGYKLCTLAADKDPDVVRFLKLTEQNGFTITLGSYISKRGCLNAYCTAFKAFKALGDEKYCRMLRLIRLVWSGALWSVSRNMIGGMSRFMRMYDFSDVDFVRAFRHIGKEDIIAVAATFRGYSAEGAFAQAIAEIFDTRVLRYRG